MDLFLEKSSRQVSLLPPFKEGGEGTIHPIIGDPGIVAKVFKQPSSKRAEKLRAMIDNPPVVTGNAPITLAWPVDRLLTRTGECVGYVMPYVKDKVSLFTVYNPGSRPERVDWPILLQTAKNICLAVSAFHRHGYVVGDINESNVLVGRDGSVAVVDTDSIQVGKFRCEVGKPEFTAPELIQSGKTFADIDRYPHHDAFGLAVLIFHLLMDGNHPFSAHYEGTTGRESLTNRIAQGHWPYSLKRNGMYRPRREAPPLESLSPEIQRLMREAFEEGHRNPVCRPTADDWHVALTKAEEEWNEIGTKLRHFYYRSLIGQAWGQKVLDGFGWVRSKVPPLPRKVWVGTCCVLLIALLMLGYFALPRSPEGRGNHQVEEKIEKPEREVQGEETPWLWREAQRLNRMKK